MFLGGVDGVRLTSAVTVKLSHCSSGKGRAALLGLWLGVCDDSATDSVIHLWL